VKILVVIPPYVLGEENKAVMPNKAMLPVGPLIVAGQLRECGHQIEVLDLVFEKEWWQAFSLSVPDLVLISCHTARNIPCCATVLDELRKVWGWLPHTVLGGNIAFDINIVDFAQLGLEVDAVVRGFAHGTDVLKAIGNRLEGDIQPDKKLITGNLPVPALDFLLPTIHAKYLLTSGGRYPLYVFGLGCKWGCAYCSSKGRLGWTSQSSLTAVAQQISLVKQLGYSEIWVVDNLLFTDITATLKFDRLVAAQEMIWSGMTRAELVCELPVGFLGQLTSLREVAIGVESASLSLLPVLRRGQAQNYHQNLLEAFGRINAAGIASNAFIILDLPGMADADFWSLYDFLCQLHPGTISWSFYNPPAQQVVDGKFRPSEMGFYRWPLGFSAVPPERVVQWAMVLSGRWWKPFWTPDLSRPFFEDGKWFGTNFLEGRILQNKDIRSATGEIWLAWKKGRRW
jgi:radical SAM superfamily enzyme YgiQ (UPF0313 family)